MADSLTARTCEPDIPGEVLSRQLFALVPTVIVTTLSITTYGLRLLCRKKTSQKLWWDDYLMGAGMLIALEPSICELLLVHNGLGHHVCNVSRATAMRFARISFALQRANQPALGCIKTSIVLFYTRIFTTKKFRIAACCVIAYTLAWAVSTWIVNLTVCSPIAFYYDRTIPNGHCRNQAISGSINGGLSLLGDIIVLCLPIPVVLNLKVNGRKKAGILGIFLLGTFVCVASTIRIVELTKFVVADPTYTQVHSSTWTTLEQGIAVISGNLPLLAPLFDRCLRGGGSYGSGSGSSFSYGSLGRKIEYLSTHAGSRNSRSAGPTATTCLDAHAGGGTTVGGASLPGNRGDPYRLSDEESQTPADSAPDIELDDRAILVKRQVSVDEPGDPGGDAPRKDSATDERDARQRARSWLRA